MSPTVPGKTIMDAGAHIVAQTIVFDDLDPAPSWEVLFDLEVVVHGEEHTVTGMGCGAGSPRLQPWGGRAPLAPKGRSSRTLMRCAGWPRTA